MNSAEKRRRSALHKFFRQSFNKILVFRRGQPLLQDGQDLLHIVFQRRLDIEPEVGKRSTANDVVFIGIHLQRRKRPQGHRVWRGFLRVIESNIHAHHELSFLNTSIGLEMIVVSASIALLPAVIVHLPRSRFTVSRTNIHQERVTMKRRDFIKDSAAAAAASTVRAMRTSKHIPGWQTSRSPPYVTWTTPCSSSAAARLKRTLARGPKSTWTFASCSKTRRLTPSLSQRRITGTR